VLYRPVPLLMVAATWYLAMTSVLMVGQYYLERHYARGSSKKLTPGEQRTVAQMMGFQRHEGGGPL
jgi:polar amino acid transport system permease protein